MTSIGMTSHCNPAISSSEFLFTFTCIFVSQGKTISGKTLSSPSKKPAANQKMPSKTVQSQKPSKPVVNKTPSKTIVNQKSAKPVVNQTVSKPVINHTPSKPVINHTPSKPVVNQRVESSSSESSDSSDSEDVRLLICHLFFCICMYFQFDNFSDICTVWFWK